MPSQQTRVGKSNKNHDLRRRNGQPERVAKKNDGGETKTRLLNWEPYLAAKTQYIKLLGY